MSAFLSVLAFAALFALFGALRPKRGCKADCGACPAACHRMESNDEEV